MGKKVFLIMIFFLSIASIVFIKKYKKYELACLSNCQRNNEIQKPMLKQGVHPDQSIESKATGSVKSNSTGVGARSVYISPETEAELKKQGINVEVLLGGLKLPPGVVFQGYPAKSDSTAVPTSAGKKTSKVNGSQNGKQQSAVTLEKDTELSAREKELMKQGINVEVLRKPIQIPPDSKAYLNPASKK